MCVHCYYVMRVCVYVCACVYVCVCMSYLCGCWSINVQLWVRVCARMCEYMYACMCVRTYMYSRFFVCECVWVYGCVYVRGRIFVLLTISTIFYCSMFFRDGSSISLLVSVRFCFFLWVRTCATIIERVGIKNSHSLILSFYHTNNLSILSYYHLLLKGGL